MKVGKRVRKKADEREQLILYKAEQQGFWVMFTIAALACIVKGYILGRPPADLGWELAIVLAGAVTLVWGSVRKGFFDAGFDAKPSTYLRYSLLGAFLITAIFCVGKIYQYPYLIKKNGLASLLAMAAIFGISTFALCFAAYAAAGMVANRKKRRLDRELEEDEDEADGESRKDEDLEDGTKAEKDRGKTALRQRNRGREENSAKK